MPAPLTPEQENIAIAEQVQQAQYINQKVIEANAAWAASFGPDGPPLGEQPPPYDPAADPNYPKSTVQPTWIDRDSPEGQKVIQQLSNVGSYAIVGGKGGKIVPMDLDEKGFPKDAATMVRVSRTWVRYQPRSGYQPSATSSIGSIMETARPPSIWLGRPDGMLPVPQSGFLPGTSLPDTKHRRRACSGTTEGLEPQPARAAELENPTVDAAGSNMAAAMGSYVKTGLMNEASRNSALVDEAGQPLTSTDTGVLNRVMRESYDHRSQSRTSPRRDRPGRAGSRAKAGTSARTACPGPAETS